MGTGMNWGSAVGTCGLYPSRDPLGSMQKAPKFCPTAKGECRLFATLHWLRVAPPALLEGSCSWLQRKQSREAPECRLGRAQEVQGTVHHGWDLQAEGMWREASQTLAMGATLRVRFQ